MVVVVALSLTAAAWPGPVLAQDAPAPAAPADPAVAAAAQLLRAGMQVAEKGQHHILLRALRQLRDPRLRPLFERLAASQHPELLIHGLLGLAETEPDRRLDLVRVAEIESPLVQEQVVSAAMDSDLLDEEAALQIAQWQNVSVGARLLVALDLVRRQKLPETDLLRRAARSDNLRRRALAHLLLLQSGDAAGLEGLRELDRSTDASRDEVRDLLLTTALRYEYDRAAPWAMEVAQSAATPRRLALSALQVALRFGAPGAAELWRQRYASEADPAQRARLALTALQVAPWAAPALFDALEASEDPLTRRVAAAGRAVAAKRGVAEAVLALVAMNNNAATAWALAFAHEHAQPADARAIFIGVIRAGTAEPERNRAQRLYNAAMAVEALVEGHAAEAPALLREVLQERRADAELTQAVLLGLVRAPAEDAARVIDGMAFRDPRAADIALVILAKTGRPLTPEQLRALSVLVRGGGSLPAALRVQAAWCYVRLTDQAEAALALAAAYNQGSVRRRER